jgi:DNA sulfur modification protein DndD
MILKSLTLQNIGSFYGRHQIDLCPGGDDKPIVLIGALNGSGKTTILESLQLGLYGKRARSLFRIKTGYDDYLRKLFNRKAEVGDSACVEIVLSHDEGGRTTEYRVVRAWKFETKLPSEAIQVFVDDMLDPALSDTWDEQVERLIPRNLAHLFFFDGEKIEMLADPSQSAEILRTGIYSLLGIELVDQLHADLSVFRRRLKKRTATPEELNEIARVESELQQKQAQIRDFNDRSASLTTDLDAAKKALATARTRFQNHGGEIFENRSTLEKDRIETTSALNQINSSLRELCTHALPLCVVAEELHDLAKKAEQDKLSKSAQQLLSSFTERDHRFLDWLDGQSAATADFRAAIGQYLVEDRKSLEQVALLEAHMDMSDDTLGHLQALLASTLRSERQKVWKLLNQHSQVTAGLETIDRSLEMMPEETLIRSYLEEKANAEAQCTLIAKERDKLSELRNQARFAADKLEKELERLVSNVRQQELDADESTRLADYSATVQHILDELRRRSLVDHLTKLESYISEAFRRLLRKESLVESVHIDPDSFSVTLSSRDGTEITPQLISAGERQLLAIALLWGLGRAAGRRIPIVIDTPLGRLDSVHRKQLVDEYFPDASHQVVLLSTDEEIDEELSEDLAGSIAQRYMLHYDDAAEFTTIKRGYFWH